MIHESLGLGPKPLKLFAARYIHTNMDKPIRLVVSVDQWSAADQPGTAMVVLNFTSVINSGGHGLYGGTVRTRSARSKQGIMALASNKVIGPVGSGLGPENVHVSIELHNRHVAQAPQSGQFSITTTTLCGSINLNQMNQTGEKFGTFEYGPTDFFGDFAVHGHQKFRVIPQFLGQGKDSLFGKGCRLTSLDLAQIRMMDTDPLGDFSNGKFRTALAQGLPSLPNIITKKLTHLALEI